MIDDYMDYTPAQIIRKLRDLEAEHQKTLDKLRSLVEALPDTRRLLIAREDAAALINPK